jgi:hypothetical protein
MKKNQRAVIYTARAVKPPFQELQALAWNPFIYLNDQPEWIFPGKESYDWKANSSTWIDGDGTTRDDLHAPLYYRLPTVVGNAEINTPAMIMKANAIPYLQLGRIDNFDKYFYLDRRNRQPLFIDLNFFERGYFSEIYPIRVQVNDDFWFALETRQTRVLNGTTWQNTMEGRLVTHQYNNSTTTVWDTIAQGEGWYDMNREFQLEVRDNAVWLNIPGNEHFMGLAFDHPLIVGDNPYVELFNNTNAGRNLNEEFCVEYLSFRVYP